MTSAQVVETSVNVISNSPSQDYTHPDDRTLLYDMTPGFKPFTILHTIHVTFIDKFLFANTFLRIYFRRGIHAHLPFRQPDARVSTVSA